MKTEIIIAVRGEKPENLRRTVEACNGVADACVVFDGRESGNEVPGWLKGKARIIQGPPVPCGCGRARHEGISTSKADLIVLCDGHMTFPPDWMDKIQAAHAKRKDLLTCCRMQSLDQNAKPLPDKTQGGAFLALKSREVHQIHWALSAKWNSPPRKRGDISAVMGACYAFRRAWYKRLGEPLRVLRAWGGDEELLSLGTHFMGGRVMLLPVDVGHIYMAAHIGRVRTADEEEAKWANRYAVVDAIPMEESERDELRGWMARSPRIGVKYSRSDAALELREVWANGKKTWADLKAEGIVRALTEKEQAGCLGRTVTINDECRYTPPPAPAHDQTQIVQRRADACERCGARNSFRQIRGMRPMYAFHTAPARCFNCGHKAQIRLIVQ